MIKFLSKGKIRPITPITVFHASKVQDAFRYVQNSDHIGKAVVQIPTSFSDVTSVPRDNKLWLDSGASYLLTGGLGGLGKAISTWLVERGAKSLVFLSRNAGSSYNEGFLRELESSGCSVTIVPGKAESMEDVQNAVLKSTRPVKGVIHLAMVLQVRINSPIRDEKVNYFSMSD